MLQNSCRNTSDFKYFPESMEKKALPKHLKSHPFANCESLFLTLIKRCSQIFFSGTGGDTNAIKYDRTKEDLEVLDAKVTTDQDPILLRKIVVEKVRDESKESRK